MELWLLRHAHAPWTTAVPDLERPLDSKGRKQASSLGQWLQSQAFQPDLVVVSPATRTQETAALALDGRGPSPTVDHRLYEASLTDLMQVIQGLPAAGKVLVVAHNPGFDQLVRTLAGAHGYRGDPVSFDPCTWVQLDLKAVRPGGASVLAVQHASTG